MCAVLRRCSECVRSGFAVLRSREDTAALRHAWRAINLYNPASARLLHGCVRATASQCSECSGRTGAQLSARLLHGRIRAAASQHSERSSCGGAELFGRGERHNVQADASFRVAVPHLYCIFQRQPRRGCDKQRYPRRREALADELRNSRPNSQT